MARAMQSLCCWPPDSLRADSSRRSLTSSHSPTSLSTSSMIEFRSSLGLTPQIPKGFRDVFGDAHREGVRLLKNHAHFFTEFCGVVLGV